MPSGISRTRAPAFTPPRLTRRPPAGDVGMVSAAWKMRVVVYGLLAAAAALVLAARPSAYGGDVPTDGYSGLTAQATQLQISLVGRRFHSLNAAGIWARCKGRPRVGVTWSPAE